MISDPVELAAQRIMTDYFIKADPIELVLHRRTKVSNGQGGFTWSAPASLTSQIFKLIPQSRQLLDRQTPEGNVVQPDHVLMGYHDASIERGDYFLIDGARYDIVFVHEKHDFETMAEVKFRGQQS